jgi:large subunit ribosomal protein L16
MLASFSNVPTKLRFTKYRKRTTIPGRFELTHTSPNKPGTAVLKAVTDGRLSPAQLEAARKVLRRKLKKVGTIKAYTFPSVAITKKSVGVRMGKGRSAVAD